MSLSTIRAAITELGKEIPGIESCLYPPPGTLDTATLPALYVLIGESIDDSATLGAERILERREWRIQVAVAPYGEGNIAQIEEAAETLIPNTKAVYHNNPGLDGVNGVQNSRVIGDTGTGMLQEYGGKYVGFEVRLEVEQYVVRQITEG